MSKWIVGVGLSLALLAPAGAGAADDAGAVWTKQCSKCHGKEGKGDTKTGKKLKAKDYSDAAWQAKAVDADLLKAIREGAGEAVEGEKPMPAFAADKVSDDQAKALVAFIRTLKAK